MEKRIGFTCVSGRRNEPQRVSNRVDCRRGFGARPGREGQRLHASDMLAAWRRIGGVCLERSGSSVAAVSKGTEYQRPDAGRAGTAMADAATDDTAADSAGEVSSNADPAVVDSAADARVVDASTTPSCQAACTA